MTNLGFRFKDWGLVLGAWSWRGYPKLNLNHQFAFCAPTFEYTFFPNNEQFLFFYQISITNIILPLLNFSMHNFSSLLLVSSIWFLSEISKDIFYRIILKSFSHIAGQSVSIPRHSRAKIADLVTLAT